MADQRWLIDTEPSERFPVYTRLNAGDVLPDPITPIGASLAWIPFIFPGWQTGYFDMGGYLPTETIDDQFATGGFYFGYLYVNQSHVRVSAIRAGIGWRAVDAAFFSPDSPPHDDDPRDANDRAAAAMAETTKWVLTTTTFPNLEEERGIADRMRAQRLDLAGISSHALVAYARSLMPIERLVWRSYVVASNQAATGPAIMNSLLGNADPSLTIKIIGQAGDVDSAAPSYALWDLSRAVRADAQLTATFDQGVDGLLGRLHDDHPDFGARFAGFLRDYGYRGPSEWDLGAHAWETRPELALALIDRLRQLDDSASPANRQLEHSGEAEQALAKALEIIGDNPEAVQTFHAAAAASRRWASWRERGKTNAIKVIHEARVAMMELGRRLHAEGHLESPMHVMMAVDSELDLLVADPPALSQTLADRYAQWRELFDLDIPTWVDGRKPIPSIADLPRRSAKKVAGVQAGDVLQGQGASAGIGRGKARVVLDTASIADFEPGEILIAPQTDPSWTPLFMVSAGVVVDTGAMGSHAMIVSRELGIPCAAGVTDATKRIPTGATVEIDGSTGTVRVLEV